MKFVLLLVLLIVIFAISITLGANNDQMVTFNYLLAYSELRLSTLLAILFGSGFILGWILTGIFYLRIRLKLTAIQRKQKKLQKMYDDVVAEQQRTELTGNLTNK